MSVIAFGGDIIPLSVVPRPAWDPHGFPPSCLTISSAAAVGDGCHVLMVLSLQAGHRIWLSEQPDVEPHKGAFISQSETSVKPSRSSVHTREVSPGVNLFIYFFKRLNGPLLCFIITMQSPRNQHLRLKAAVYVTM